MNDILLQTDLFRLTVGADGTAKSLVCLDNGEECLADSETPLFSVTEDRPYNNEVKLSHPNKRTVFPANRVRREGSRLIVGFSLAPFEAVVEVTEAAGYLVFTLADFIVHPDDYPGLRMALPPVAEFRLMQLPVKNRSRFGAWLNVSWDDETAVCVLAADPTARIEAESRRGYRILTADAVRGIRLRGSKAALIVCPSDRFLDVMDTFEADLGLPRGAASRRGPDINASVYWSSNVTPENVDEHIAYAKKGGFRLMLLYYTSLFRERNGYALNGNYDYRPEYPNGRDDLAGMLERIRAAGITPGLHVLQTHIGLESRYVTPTADHRLHLTRRFTLAKPLSLTDDELFVEEDPTDSVTDEKCRLLMFGGELISYTSYTTERPYRFTGCTRGARSTDIVPHPLGQVGGLLDVSEYGASSCYLDQESSLADEIGDKIADAYNAGFRFMYFDGSEGTNAPFAYFVPMGQYRVYRKLAPAPLFTEGAAKAHFSWHFLSGGNAFDVFPPEVFKAKIDEFPLEEAPRMREDFTRLNFGWWNIRIPGTQPDLFEYGTSRAAAWDCPATIQIRLDLLKAHPRTDDLLEVMRRWEDVRARGLLTEAQKDELKQPGVEHILVKDGNGGYELFPYRQIEVGAPEVRAFVFDRNGQTCIVCWHMTGEGTLSLPFDGDVQLYDDFDRPAVNGSSVNGTLTLPVGARRYLLCKAPEADVLSAFARANLNRRKKQAGRPDPAPRACLRFI